MCIAVEFTSEKSPKVVLEFRNEVLGPKGKVMNESAVFFSIPS